MAYTNRDQIYKWLSGLLLLDFQFPERRQGLRGPKDEDLLLQVTLYISLECHLDSSKRRIGTWQGHTYSKVLCSPAPDSALHTEIVPDCLDDIR